MNSRERSLVVPVLLIAVGAGGLLTTLEIVPDIDWIWTLALAATGALTLTVGGIDKLSVVLGPFLLASSALSILRQTGLLPLRVEIPILVILAGVLLLVARATSLRMPEWLAEERAGDADAAR